MKFLVDAQLPKRLATLLCELGHDAIHTQSLPQGNGTRDALLTEDHDAVRADSDGALVE
jgi:predicted nuclease of predicted toxin-antitoxin system